jgi:hypothetical protein
MQTGSQLAATPSRLNSTFRSCWTGPHWLNNDTRWNWWPHSTTSSCGNPRKIGGSLSLKFPTWTRGTAWTGSALGPPAWIGSTLSPPCSARHPNRLSSAFCWPSSASSAITKEIAVLLSASTRFHPFPTQHTLTGRTGKKEPQYRDQHVDCYVLQRYQVGVKPLAL